MLLILLVCACEFGAQTKIPPKAEKGVLDLSNWDFANDGPVDLTGEYVFFWKRLISPRDLSEDRAPQPSGYIEVPGFWHMFDADDTRVAAEGYATYRLRIILAPDNGTRSLAIKYLDMGTAFNLFLNGEPLCSVGRVGKTPETSHPRYHPGIADFKVSGAGLNLILQVSNFHHRRGGAWDKLTLGKARDLQAIRDRRINYDVFLFGSIFIMAIYHLGLFLLRRKEISPLFFSIFCLLVALRILTTGERYLLALWPTINWQLLGKLEYLSFYLAVPAFTQFVHHLFLNRFSKKFSNLVSITGLLFAAAVILLPVRLFSHTLTAYQLFTLAIFLYALYVLVLASLRKQLDAIVFLLGFFLIFATATNDILHNENIIQTGDLIPLGLFLFIFSQAFLQSLRFSRAFSLVDRQRLKLRDTNHAFKKEISDRVEAEKALKDSHQRFLNVLDSIAADVYVSDMQTHEILFMNQHMANSYAADYTGQICWKTLRNRAGPCEHCTNDQLLNADGKPADVQIWECRNPVSGRWYVNYDRAIVWDHGHIVRLQVATDVTERKLAEETLKQAKADLEKRVTARTAEILSANEKLRLEIEERKRAQATTKRAKREAENANKAKSKFLANMSHELRTPLNHIIGFTELVLSKKFGDLNANQEDYLNDVHHSSHHLLSLINDILDISKVEAGKLELEPTEVNLGRILENSLIMIKEKAMRHAIELKLISNGVPDVISADERKLKQIMYNLLSNAVKFTPDGGRLTVSAAFYDYSDMGDTAAAHMDGPGIKISVTDTGIGLQQEDIDCIFKPFEQVENSTSRRFQGTGLGLSLTKNLVELHGGSIWVESRGAGRGSTFCFTIPIDRNQAKRMQQAALQNTARNDIRNVGYGASSFFRTKLH